MFSYSNYNRVWLETLKIRKKDKKKSTASSMFCFKKKSKQMSSHKELQILNKFMHFTVLALASVKFWRKLYLFEDANFYILKKKE